MSDEQAKPDELTVLKQRARMMGIEFSNNIGIDALKSKINAKLGDAPEEVKTEEVQANPLDAPAATSEDQPKAAPVKPVTLRAQVQAEQMKLVRCRITNLDPKKKDLHGEIFTVANGVLGTVRKFVPYGELTDDGFHIPYCIYRQLESRKFLHVRTTKDRKTGAPLVHTTWAKEFAIEVLPTLTAEELQQLATAQIAAGSID